MAEFEAAFYRLMEHEGGYSDHPDDRGGETYRGIARNAHPDWPGWERIDRYKNAEAFPKVLDADHALKGWIQDFYRDNYWRKVGGDQIQNQEIAEFVFDFAVNAGVQVAAEHLQRALNVLNRKATLWPDLVVDGDVGPKTQAALVKYAEWEGPAPLRKILIGLRTAFYVTCVERREANETFIRGWLNRLRLR